MSHFVVQIIDVKGYGASAIEAFHQKIQPSAIVVLGMIGANPHIILHRARTTDIEEAFYTKERFPESNSELNRTGPS